MSRLVIDSGVAVKWFVSEAQSADAARIRDAYDSLYLALALREGCPFVTADQKLVNALAGTVPGVTWLGNWP